jgi:hypothetical protein
MWKYAFKIALMPYLPSALAHLADRILQTALQTGFTSLISKKCSSFYFIFSLQTH